MANLWFIGGNPEMQPQSLMVHNVYYGYGMSQPKHAPFPASSRSIADELQTLEPPRCCGAFPPLGRPWPGTRSWSEAPRPIVPVLRLCTSAPLLAMKAGNMHDRSAHPCTVISLPDCALTQVDQGLVISLAASWLYSHGLSHGTACG